jgi:signal transduction histidine kinase/ActR/RegA family two-component response regulator
LKNRNRRGVRAYAWHLSLIGLVVGLLWTGIGFSLWHEYKAADQEAEKDTANLARTFAEDITRTVESVDQTLLFLRQAYQHDRSGFTSGSWAIGHAFLEDLHAQMALVGPEGATVWSSLGSPTAGVNVADRMHFQVQKQAMDDNLFIGPPLIGRVSGKLTMQFTRKLFAPDGSFDGIAVVSLDSSYLSRFYQSISIGKGAIVLATTDGMVLARAPERQALIGSHLPPDLLARLLHGATNGAYRAVSPIDHIDRIFSSRRLTRYPLVLSVGLATEEVFAPFERNKRLYLVAGIVLSAASLLVGLVILRQGQSMQDSRHALAVTLENMSQGIMMIRAGSGVPVMNQRAIELLGLPHALVAGQPTFQQILAWQFNNQEFIEPENWNPGLVPFLRGQRGLNDDYIYERTRPNGMTLEIRTRGLPDGDFVRTYTDITERKQNEVALIAAQTRAAHAERIQALGQLAGGIAHDFNNILQAVQGGASLINKRAADTDRVQRFARLILDATERGTSITRRLLSFARRGELRAEPVDTVELLTGLRDVLSYTLGSAIVVDVVLPPGVPPLFADKGQLETVLVNLATNARDAMPDGGSLTLTATMDVVTDSMNHAAELRPGRYVRLSVADTGTGIDKPNLTRVLEPFFSTKPAGQGTGLGLSMAKGFAEQSGGGLLIESGVPHGINSTSVPHSTTVNVWLPAASWSQTPSAVRFEPDTLRDDLGKCVLLVDDEAMVRATLAAALEDFGYTVLVAADGTEALDRLVSSEGRVDVLVTDLSMPGIDGLEVIRQAQRHRPGLPAVLLTGYAGHGAQLAVGGSVSGAFSLLRKPVTVAQLADRIEALLAVVVAG